MLCKYGRPPFKVAVVHGGPGAPGEMAAMARELSKTRGVLEPLQIARTIEGEVEELRETLIKSSALPATLIGYSWGAWLSFILTARYPSLVSKLVLVSSAPFTQEYALEVERTRFSRLSARQKEETRALLADLDNPDFTGNKDRLMSSLGKLFGKADSFDALPHRDEAECRWDIFAVIWPQALALRRSGELLSLGKQIKCPVVAIHGDFDPHPAEGVRVPLSAVVRDFRFILLERCGHTPWNERQARGRFYQVLQSELDS